MNRRTLSNTVDISGVGLHSGRVCRARLRPATPGHGITVNDHVLCPELLCSSALATTLQTAKGPVSTVEHLFAALHGQGIDDVAIDVEGAEVPILDGSAEPWARLLDWVEQAEGDPNVFTLKEMVHVGDEQRYIKALPAEQLSISVDVDFPELGRQRYSQTARGWSSAAPARTFGFRSDAARLHASGLALGANLDNTLVFDQGKPMNAGGLRFNNEVARHKWIDLFGDLLLLGFRLQARVIAYCNGHELHHEFVRALARLEHT